MLCVGIMGFYFNTSYCASHEYCLFIVDKISADAERANIRKVRDFVISVEGKYKVSKNLCQIGLILNELQELNMEILEMCHHSPTYLWTIKRHLH